MSLIVQKFGGSSVRDHEHLLRMARIVKGNVDRGDEVLVVLSAQGDTTDGLLQKAKEMSAAPSPRELDMLLSAGEQMSAALGAMALESIGVPAVSLCAWQIPIETDARIRARGSSTSVLHVWNGNSGAGALWSRRGFKGSTRRGISQRSDAAALTQALWRLQRRCTPMRCTSIPM